MRQVILDTETTGIQPSEGHRIIEIGCVELVDRKLTHHHYHQYINPQRQVEAGALEVHGITNDFLSEKPLFVDVYDDFLDYIKGAEVIIHNAAFDVGFINHELRLAGHDKVFEDYCTVLDTLELARKKHPGQKNSLDALCKRYSVDNSHRELHGALLDSEILADVYLLMTGGQGSLSLAADEDAVTKGSVSISESRAVNASNVPLTVVRATDSELREHRARMDAIAEASELVKSF